jgi:N-acetylglucosamine malate deacetylase 1
VYETFENIFNRPFILTILILAPHADDEVLGMGGSIARWSREGKKIVLAVLTGHGEEKHPIWPESIWEAIRSECYVAAEILGISEIIFKNLPAACLDMTPAWKINKIIAELLSEVKPSEIFIPFEFDLHKDHAAVAYGLYVAARPYLKSSQCIKRVLAYETLSETNLAPPFLTPAFQPNVFVSIEETLSLKLEAMSAYQTQLQADGLPRSIASLRALATLRGAHIGSEAAEGFVLLGEFNR